MTKLRSIILSAAVVAVAACACVGLAACGDSTPAAEIDKVLINSATISNAMGYGEDGYTMYEAVLYDDGTYMYTTTSYYYGFSMNLGNQVVTAFGTYTTGSTVDGYTSYSLSAADRVIFIMDSSMGSIHTSVDTDDESVTYPVDVGNNNTIESKDAFLSAYGAAVTIYVEEQYNTVFTFTNPNA